MAEREVTIRISAKDEFSTILNKYQTAMRGAGQSTRDVGQATETTQSGISRLSTAFVALGGAAAALKLSQVAWDMANLGREVSSARSVLDNLSGGIAQAETNLTLLRQATNGQVNDLDLMRSANALLLQGLAQTGQEAADLTGIAVTLGRAMGEDVSGSIEKFSQLLRNQSIRLLDNFGLSSARVKDRIEDLMEANRDLSREQAFVTATIEEAELAVGRLGDATVVTGDAFGTLVANFQNWKQDVAIVATGVRETAAQLLLIPGMLREIEQQRQLLNDQIVGEAVTGSGRGMVSAATPGEQQSIYRSMLADLLDTADVYGYTINELTAETAQSMMNVMGTYNITLEEAQQMVNDLRGETESGFDTIYERAGEIVNAAQSHKEAEEAITETIKDRPDVLSDMISQKDEAVEIKDAYVEAAKAVQEMQLADLFGTGGGGVGGEVHDEVVRQMRAAGATDEQIAEYERAAGLATGRETQSSLYFQETFAPALGTAIQTGQISPEQYGEILRNAEVLLQGGKLGGATDAQIIQMLGMGGTGFMPTEGAFTMNLGPAATSRWSDVTDVPRFQNWAAGEADKYGVSPQDVINNQAAQQMWLANNPGIVSNVPTGQGTIFGQGLAQVRGQGFTGSGQDLLSLFNAQYPGQIPLAGQEYKLGTGGIATDMKPEDILAQVLGGGGMSNLATLSTIGREVSPGMTGAAGTPADPIYVSFSEVSPESVIGYDWRDNPYEMSPYNLPGGEESWWGQDPFFQSLGPATSLTGKMALQDAGWDVDVASGMGGMSESTSTMATDIVTMRDALKIVGQTIEDAGPSLEDNVDYTDGWLQKMESTQSAGEAIETAIENTRTRLEEMGKEAYEITIDLKVTGDTWIGELVSDGIKGDIFNPNIARDNGGQVPGSSNRAGLVR